MGDLLSQEEIDALLNASSGIGSAMEPEESYEPEPAPAPSPRGGRGSARRQPTPDMSANRNQAERTQGKLRNVRGDPDDVVIAPAVFYPLDADDEVMDQTNMDLILDTDLEIRAELGSAVRTIREILELGPGSVIELNKLSGEPVDLFVNARNFSRGEVVVIADSFGIRVTDILSVQERIEALGPG
ncbi:MAG TPA: FliM/FliN family flagellar motor switch protein [bacterium]|nr:FliM/FliN family flagellar motor switch protein [bacterium]HPO07846.1 FliM/FliN family flagellar motor switch protein [bacterium]HQQ00742.1 FliM/FliN family flagellar motor switch protein [bacterium]